MKFFVKEEQKNLFLKKTHQHFWSLILQSYFVLIEKVLKKVCSFEVRIICLTVSPDIRPDTGYRKGRISGTTLVNTTYIFHGNTLSLTQNSNSFSSDILTMFDRPFHSSLVSMPMTKCLNQIYRAYMSHFIKKNLCVIHSYL